MPFASALVVNVKALVKAGADVNESDTCGSTPLMWAFTMGVGGPMLRLRPSQRALAKERDRVDKADKKRLQIATWLLDEGADPLRQDANGETALFHAAVFSSNADQIIPLIARMLAAGVEINRPDVRGSTPLMGAAFHAHSRIVAYLLSKGASVDARDKQGKTALDVAEEQDRKQVVEILSVAGGKLGQ